MIPASDLRAAADAVAAGSRIVDVVELEGGTSAVVALVRLELPNGALRRVVVRQHRDRAVKGHAAIVARKEFDLLRALGRQDLPVPAPIALHGDDNEGGPWLALEWADGSSMFEPERSDEVVDAMVAFLTRLHSIEPEGLDVPGLERIEDPVPDLPRFLPADDVGGAVRRTLASGFDRSPNDDAVLHGDYWPGNVLFDDGRLVAVIDWEDAAIGDPLVDLACSRVELTGVFGAEAAERFTIDYVAAVGGLDLTDLPLWEIYVSATALAAMHRWGLTPAEEAQRRTATRGCLESAASRFAT